MEDAALDPQRQQKAKTYARLNRRLMLVDLLIGAAYTLAWLLTGASQALARTLAAWTSSPWLQVAAFAAIFGLGLYLINLPLSYYSDYVLPHRFDLSNLTVGGWISDEIKGLLVAGILGGLLLEVVYAVLRAFPNTWWLWTGLILLLFSVVLANLAPVLLMPIFYRFTPLGEEHAGLAQRLVRLSERAGTRVQGVYKFDMSRRTRAANAALTGLGNTRRILLGDTLLDEFSDDEIETVLAHELGHHVNRDIPLSILVQTVLTLGGLYLAHLGLQWGVRLFGFQGVWDPAAMPLFAIAMGVYGLVTMPLSNAYSRWRERKADEYALQATQAPRAFASAMTRLANQNLADVDPEPWVEFLLYSHPALGRRIKMAEEYRGS